MGIVVSPKNRFEKAHKDCLGLLEKYFVDGNENHLEKIQNIVDEVNKNQGPDSRFTFVAEYKDADGTKRYIQFAPGKKKFINGMPIIGNGIA